MNGLLAVLLLSLHTIAPAPSAGADSAGRSHVAAAPVTRLDVPMVRQARERCGQAALTMVLRFYGAPAEALLQVDRAYDPALHGSLITDLAEAARRAGYDAQVATLDSGALIELLGRGVPAIVLYQNGSGPLTVRHYGVVSGWDAAQNTFTVLDGSASPRQTSRADLEKRWKTAGSQALVVTLRQP